MTADTIIAIVGLAFALLTTIVSSGWSALKARPQRTLERWLVPARTRRNLSGDGS